MVPSHAAVVSLLHAARVIESRGTSLFAKWDLHPAQFNVLNLLQTNGGRMEQAEIKHQLIVSSATVAIVLRRLSKRGLVKNATNPMDRRKHTILLTPLGRKTWNEAATAYQQALAEVRDALSDKQLQVLEQLCTKLASQLATRATPKTDAE